MARCEDFPACGHMDEDGTAWCPDEDGRFRCCVCNERLEEGARSSICGKCQRNPATWCEGQDCPGCAHCMGGDEDDMPFEDEEESYDTTGGYDGWSFE